MSDAREVWPGCTWEWDPLLNKAFAVFAVAAPPPTVSRPARRTRAQHCRETLSASWLQYYGRQRTVSSLRDQAQELLSTYESSLVSLPDYPEIADAKLELAGSALSGFAVGWSDVNICLHSGGGVLSSRAFRMVVIELSRQLADLDIAVTRILDIAVTRISQSRIPRAKLASKGQPTIDLFPFDEMTLRNTELIRRYANFDDRVIPFVRTVKAWGYDTALVSTGDYLMSGCMRSERGGESSRAGTASRSWRSTSSSGAA